MCQFYEVYSGSYVRYRSVADSSRYLGFNKWGKPMKNPHGRQKCFNFIKFNPHFNINHHNSLVTANMGGMEPPIVVPRKASSSVRATKNSLHVDDSPRESITARRHHRHSNRWNIRANEEASSRRQQRSRLYLQASKYWVARRDSSIKTASFMYWSGCRKCASIEPIAWSTDMPIMHAFPRLRSENSCHVWTSMLLLFSHFRMKHRHPKHWNSWNRRTCHVETLVFAAPPYLFNRLFYPLTKLLASNLSIPTQS